MTQIQAICNNFFFLLKVYSKIKIMIYKWKAKQSCTILAANFFHINQKYKLFIDCQLY